MKDSRVPSTRTQVLVASATALAAVALLVPGARAEQAGSWPVELEFQTSTLQTPALDGPSETSTFRFSGSSWSDWELRQIAGSERGPLTCTIRRADGDVLLGDGGCEGASSIDRVSAGAPSLPHPLLRGEVLGITGRVASGSEAADDGRMKEVARQLRVDPRELVSQVRTRRDLPCSVLGLVCRVGGGLHVMTTIVHAPSGLVLHHEERFDDVIVASLEVIEIGLTPSP